MPNCSTTLLGLMLVRADDQFMRMQKPFLGLKLDMNYALIYNTRQSYALRAEIHFETKLFQYYLPICSCDMW